MQTKFHHILIALGLFILSPIAIMSGYSQDAAGAPSYDAYEPEADRERERIISSPGENTEPVIIKPSSQTNTVKDSTVRTPVQRQIKHPAEAPKNPNKPKNEDDSILSFNFLYYIIQKYKLQDIID